MRIIAFDPGYERLGVAILEKDAQGKSLLLYSGCVRTSKQSSFHERLHILIDAADTAIAQFIPTTCALETLFFSKNQKTGMHVAEVRGALMAIALRRGLSIVEFSPNEVKIAITGSGNADKQAMMHMIPRLVIGTNPQAIDDEFDAIAVGLTCLAVHR